MLRDVYLIGDIEKGVIYRIVSARSGKPLRQIIRDTKGTDFYLDATRALEYGVIDKVLGVTHASTPVLTETTPARRSEAAAAVEAPMREPSPRTDSEPSERTAGSAAVPHPQTP